MKNIDILNLSTLQAAYTSRSISPKDVLDGIRTKSIEFKDHNIWIHLLSEDELAFYLSNLENKDPKDYPLWGVPFAIKDNIDLMNIPTTAACEAFSYTPTQSAHVVQQLIDAGAIPIGKTNLDQFATGLNGTRSPWGACKNAFDPKYISGGSSSGSAVAVALGLASFSLGTDTAGSGRVPACFNNLVGVKPTLGLLSASGLVPACRSLDCISIMACNTDDANTVLSVAEGFDINDGYSRKNPFSNSFRSYGEYTTINPNKDLTIGIIPDSQLKFFGDDDYRKAYQKTIEKISSSEKNIHFINIDYQAFNEAALLLYEGPWVSERYLSTQPLIDEKPDALYSVVKDIIIQGSQPKAVELFKAQYRLRELKQLCDKQLDQIDCLLTPTAGSCFTINELLKEPILRNSELGYYTNFMNLLDYSSIAVPTQIADNGLPFGITLVSTAFTDRRLLSIAKMLQDLFDLPMGASDFKPNKNTLSTISATKNIDVLVCGAHLQGLPLNWQLSERNACLIKRTKTAPIYRMYALAGGPPFRPGLVLDEKKGAAIDVEIWSVPSENFGSFVDGIPSPLGIGKVTLEDNTKVSGFICEAYGLKDAEEITHLSGWRNYLEKITSDK